MTLERLADGSHRFTPPVAPYISPTDAFGRTAAPGAPVTRPIGPPHMTQPQPVKDHGMDGYEVVSFMVEPYDARGTWQQEGPYSESHANFADNEMVCDGPNIMRHPFKVGEEPAADGTWVPAANVSTLFYRMVTAYFSDTLFATMGIFGTLTNPAPQVWAETSATNPVMAKVATYAPNANSKQILCMSVVETGGAKRLWIGYESATAPALGCEAFASAALTAPTQVDTSNGHAGTQNQQISGIIQAPNGDILVATASGDLRLATNNDAALAAISFTTTQALALGGYPVAVGNISLSNYTTLALWWCVGGQGSVSASDNGADITQKGRLITSTYDGLTLDTLDFPDLPYVSIPTIYRGGVVACDRKAHFWYTGKAMVSLDGGSDRPADSHKTRLCCGHTVVGDKFVRIEAEIDDRFVTTAPDDAYNTVARVIEYDPYLGHERPISKAIDLGFGGGSLIVGGMPSLPFSPNTRNIHWFSIWEGLLATRNQDFGRWWRQYQAKNNGKGYADRSTDADASGGPAGFEGFDDAPTYTSTTFTHPSLQGFEYTPVRAIFPRVESLLAGGDDAYVDISVGGYTGTVSAAEPNDRYPYCAFGEWPNRTWSTALDVEMTSHYGTGATHKTTNVWPLTLEVIARRPIQDGIRLT